eukprot:TRINITY_DN5576_c0_g1_i2.p2 TRINITY_DN5576_c0_g1~~TRINITY_DN5576_c0_g1_i2.p2  ORF type:complete len:170 (-),score=22.92 TRINITY_DN5576_c0_g1_i2:777-1286(-)
MDAGRILDLYPAAFTLILSLLVLFTVLWILTYALDYLKAFELTDRAEESVAYFEDPKSFTKVHCPSVFDPPEKYISLIIPAYNEEARMPGAVNEMLSYLQQRTLANKSFSYEVIIIDDGSTDGTAKVAFDYVRKYSVDTVRVIRLEANQGKGAAIKKHSTRAGNGPFSR